MVIARILLVEIESLWEVENAQSRDRINKKFLCSIVKHNEADKRMFPSDKGSCKLVSEYLLLIPVQIGSDIRNSDIFFDNSTPNQPLEIPFFTD